MNSNRINSWAAGIAYGVLTTLSVALFTSAAFSGGLGSSACQQCGKCSAFRPDDLGGISKICYCGHHKSSHIR